MSLGMNDKEISFLLDLRDGVDVVKVFQFGEYISVLSFVLHDKRVITIRPRSEYIAERFEVFPMTVSRSEINGSPSKVIQFAKCFSTEYISLVYKTEWSVSNSESEKMDMLGNSAGGTTQYEGRISGMPKNTINHASFCAGIKLSGEGYEPFLAVSSINPFDMAISDSDSFSELNRDIYNYVELPK